ncbi:MAG: YceI family protein [Flavobacteriaceae bacterium]|nr:MAG: YceI family protein [Flavobacteriaceae bacterium]
MKNLKTFFFFTLLLLIGVSAQAQLKNYPAKSSELTWEGKKVSGGHSGTIKLKKGTLIFRGKSIAGGNFTVDMTSINATDLQGENQQNLNAHLKDKDFFGVKEFPESKLVFKKIKKLSDTSYQIWSDLTIKGITKPIDFVATVKNNTFTTTLKIDRTAYGIQFGSGSFFSNLGDKTIDDVFTLQVKFSY